LGWIVFFWLAKYLHAYYALLIGLLLMFSAQLMQAARLSTPDCMAALFVLSGIYCLTEKKSALACYSFLLVAILTRIDNILPCLFILSALAFINKWAVKISMVNYVLMLAGALVCFIAAPYIFSLHSLRVASFFEHLKPFSDVSAGFSTGSYISLVKSQAMNGFYHSSLLFFLFLAAILFVGVPPKYGNFNSDQLLILIIVLVIIIRFILQPVISDRFYIPYYLCLAILLVKKFSIKIYP
jgi:hypothetical protein